MGDFGSVACRCMLLLRAMLGLPASGLVASVACSHNRLLQQAHCWGRLYQLDSQTTLLYNMLYIGQY